MPAYHTSASQVGAGFETSAYVLAGSLDRVLADVRQAHRSDAARARQIRAQTSALLAQRDAILARRERDVTQRDRDVTLAAAVLRRQFLARHAAR